MSRPPSAGCRSLFTALYFKRSPGLSCKRHRILQDYIGTSIILPKPGPETEHGTKKYIRDCRLIETVDASGRIRSDYECIGGDYAYIHGPEAVGREKRRLLTAIAAGWPAFFLALIPNAASMRAVYAALPFLLTAILPGDVMRLFFAFCDTE